jgi:DNA-binding CsgD family transcriptional regulator
VFPTTTHSVMLGACGLAPDRDRRSASHAVLSPGIEGPKVRRQRSLGVTALDPLAVVEDVQSAPDLRSAWAAFSRCLARAGFEQSFLAYGISLHTDQAFSDTLHHGTLLGTVISPDYERFLAKHPEVQKTDPIVLHCARHTRPINWTDPGVHQTLTPVQTRQWHIVQDHGVTRGLSIPLHDVRGGSFGQVCVFACRDGREFDQAITRYGDVLPRATLYFHATVECRGLDHGPQFSNRLSRRETECLLRLAQGMRTRQIADKVGLSHRTVEHYLASARRKLGATTATEAVVKATLQQLVRP